MTSKEKANWHAVNWTHPRLPREEIAALEGAYLAGYAEAKADAVRVCEERSTAYFCNMEGCDGPEFEKLDFGVAVATHIGKTIKAME